MHQLALDMALPPSHACEDLAVTPANRSLIEHLEADPALHGAGLLVSGAAGSGKTHLASVWAARHGALMLPPEKLGRAPAETLLQGRHRIALDGLERVGHWPALVALMNEIRARGGQMLVTAQQAPGLHPVLLPDAQSRLMGLAQWSIPAPDDALLEAHLRKRFSDWHWLVEPAVYAYLLPRLPRDYAELTHWLHRLQASMARRPHRLTIPQLRPWFES